MSYIRLNLESFANDIAISAGTTAKLNTKIGDEYTIPGVTEETLLTFEFTYKGKSWGSSYPMYIRENLLAFYEQGILHLVDLLGD